MITRDEVIWAYEQLLGRLPESDEIIGRHLTQPSLQHLLNDILASLEYQQRMKSKVIARSGGELTKQVRARARAGSPAADGRVTLAIADLPRDCFMDEKIPLVRGWVTFPLEKAEELTHFRLGYSGHLPPEEITNVEIDLHSICQLNILLSYPDAVVRFGSGCSGRFNITCYRSARVEIGADVTANGLSLMVDDGEVTIGDDCMLAEVFIHAGDNHALFDTQTRGILNNRRALVSLEKHVWVASRATLLGGTRIGQGSIVAATATAKGNFGPCVLLAGVPAKVIKSNISWTRSPTGEGLDEVLKALDGAPR